MLDELIGLLLRRSGKPQLNARRIPRTRLRVEILEDRWTPATLNVGTGLAYTTIQSAVNAAGAGDKIFVHPGTYAEQVTVQNGDLTLTATGPGTTITAPPTLTGKQALIDVSGAIHVAISGFTIVGNANTQYGIKVENGAYAAITGNAILHIKGSNGAGIVVGKSSENTTGTAVITANLVSDYRAAGIVVDNKGSSATITYNTVAGIGPDPVIVQYGIQVSYGATAFVFGNTITGNINSGNLGTQSAGVLVLLAGPNTRIDYNSVSKNQFGIFLYQTSKTEVAGNHSFANSMDGIQLADSSYNQVFGNQTDHNAGDGISVYGGDPYKNSDGTLIPVGGHNYIAANYSYNNVGNGFYVDYSYTTNPKGVPAQNTFLLNQGSANGANGFLFVAANQNVVQQNLAQFNNASGFAFTQLSNANSILANEADFNHFYGLMFTGSANGNQIVRNGVLGNGFLSIYFAPNSNGNMVSGARRGW